MVEFNTPVHVFCGVEQLQRMSNDIKKPLLVPDPEALGQNC